MSEIARRLLLPVAFLPAVLLVSCGGDNTTEPPGPIVTTITVSPEAATLTALRETEQLTAVARDEDGEVVTTGFAWSSTNEGVATVTSFGLVTADGSGEAGIIATAEGVAGTAAITVTIDHPESAITWAAPTGGSWQTASNWVGGVVPTAGDTVVIGLPGSYTVTLDADVTVLHLELGHNEGTQTLATGANTLVLESAVVDGGAVLQADQSVTVIGSVSWLDGTITGDGTVTVDVDGELTVGGGNTNPRLETDLINGGVVGLTSDVQLDVVGGSLVNAASGLLDFRSDAFISLDINSSAINNGTLRKSAGAGIAWLSSGIGTFATFGDVEILSGTFVTSGEWASDTEIAAGATLEFFGSTDVAAGVSFTGEGTVEQDLGTLRVGDQTGQQVSFRHLVLTEGAGTVTGPAEIVVSDSLVWHRGTISGSGELRIGTDGVIRFVQSTAAKTLSGRLLRVAGRLETGAAMDLWLDDDASILIESSGRWEQGLGGLIRQRTGSTSLVEVAGVFNKLDGTLNTVETDFNISGTLQLYSGVVRATGDFWLTETGLIRGGGPEAVSGANMRLFLANATSAFIDGTIEPDFEGGPAWLDIQGQPTLTQTTTIRVDLPGDAQMPFERVAFQSGVDLDGTIMVNRTFTPDPGDMFRVVSIIDGSGTMTVIGADGFDVVQDASGVRLDWPVP